MNLCHSYSRVTNFPDLRQGNKSKSSVCCLCGYNPIFLRFLFLKFGVKGRDFIRFGYGFSGKMGEIQQKTVDFAQNESKSLRFRGITHWILTNGTIESAIVLI